jgi:hypothetical protein
MDWLTEAPGWSDLDSLLLWIKVLEICAVVLLVLAGLTLLIGWVRHLSLWVRLRALLPLAASIGAAIAVHALHTSYVYWDNTLTALVNHPRGAPLTYYRALYFIGTATHTAVVLGWIFLIVTGVLLVLGLVGVWRLTVYDRHGDLPVPLVIES